MTYCNKLSRREMLKAGAVSAAALSLHTPNAPAENRDNGQTIPVIDSHHHFWPVREDKLSAGMKQSPPQERPYLPDYFRRELDAVGVDYTVLVQVTHTLEGNDWYFDFAKNTDYVAGVVAWGDLMNPDGLEKQLAGLEKEPKFAGIRHIVEREPDGWIAQAPVIESLRILAARHIPYDMLVYPRQLPAVIKVLDAVPDLDMVINHIAKPDIANGGSPIWNELIPEIASRPNVYCKLSGLVSEADKENWTVDDLRPYADLVIEWFGLDRLMFGSNWPVCLRGATYVRVWNAANTLLSGIDADEHAGVFGGNAAAFYKLKIPAAG